MKQREIKQIVNYGYAIDVDTLTEEELTELEKQGINRLAKSIGTYGINGLLFQVVKTGQLYAVTNRGFNIFRFL